MIDQWIEHCLSLMLETPNYTQSNRIMFTSKIMTFNFPNTIELDDIGYTPKKLTDLTRSYYHDESFEGALALWKKRGEKPGSVSFSTMIETEKQHSGASRISSRIGPCLNAVSITRWPDGRLIVDTFHRSTEFCKKFPADLIWLDQLLSPFELETGAQLNCYFSNIVFNALYVPILLVQLNKPVAFLKQLREANPAFHKNVVRILRYVLEDETGMVNFAQGMKVINFTKQNLGKKQVDDVRGYLQG